MADEIIKVIEYFKNWPLVKAYLIFNIVWALIVILLLFFVFVKVLKEFFWWRKRK